MSTVIINCGACGKAVDTKEMLRIAETDIWVCRTHVLPDWEDTIRDLASAAVKGDHWFYMFNRLLTSFADNWASLLLRTPLDLETIHLGTMALTPDDLNAKQKEILLEIIDAAMDAVENPVFLQQQQGIKPSL